MKRTISLLLCLLLVFFTALPAAAAAPAEDAATLQAKFRDGTTLEGADYVYYSPISGVTDTKRYPLIVFLHGEDVGSTRRSQLDKNGFWKYASEAYQAKFAGAGGCFLFAPRRVGGGVWHQNDTKSLKAGIDRFITAYKLSIDTDRIYIIGYSKGADMLWSMLDAYPNFFAAAIPAGAITQPSTETMGKLQSVGFWLFSSYNDYYYTASSENVRKVFNNLKTGAYEQASVRMTSLSSVVLPNGKTQQRADAPSMIDTHCVWHAVTSDMQMDDGKPYSYQTTVDGTGKFLDFTDGSGVIDWLSIQSREGIKTYDIPGEALVPLRLLEFIVSLFTRLFNRLFAGASPFEGTTE